MAAKKPTKSVKAGALKKELNLLTLGDRVRIQETRPLSRTKSWRLVEIVDRNQEVAGVA